MTALELPTEAHFGAWADCIREYDGTGLDGSGSWDVDGFGPDRRSFDALLRKARLEADPTSRLSEGRVHSDHYWIRHGNEPVIGFLAVRHSIDTEFLRTLGGHIGYSIRPSRRRQGHASRALRLALDRARQLCLDRVLLTCDEENVASARTIESQGGDLEDVRSGKRRYWIPLNG